MSIQIKQERGMNQDGIWLSILEYASYKKTSISTIRRSIKGNLLKFKEDQGKYFIWVDDLKFQKEELAQKLENEFFKKRIRELEEEVSDLKMLLSVYENNSTQESELPPIPEMTI